MTQPPAAPARKASINNEKTFNGNLQKLQRNTDQMFFALLIGQWIFSILLAVFVSPYTWSGTVREIHPHVKAAVAIGALLNIPPLVLIRTRPGWWFTRQTVAVVQMLWSSLLIHITGGRIETHFHIFGSLAFLAFYKDWRLLLTATVTVASDHLVRGQIWPQSIYGVANPEWWRFFEHALWVAFEDFVLIRGCNRSILEMRRDAARESALAQSKVRVEMQVKKRTEELVESIDRYRSLVENTQAIPWELDPARIEITYIAPQASRIFSTGEEADVSKLFFSDFVHPDDREMVRKRIEAFCRNSNAETGDQFDYRATTSMGKVIAVRTIISPHLPEDPVRGITLDITQQRKLEAELNQAQKLESVGRLAAGVAHEINTPIQFVNDSVHFLRDATNDIIRVFGKLQQVRESVLNGQPDVEAANEALEAEQEADLEYLFENVPKAFDRSVDGLSRVAVIVRSMKEFAHPDARERTAVNLNRAIESTLTIARNEYKYVADLETHFGELPVVFCHAGEVNQAVLNITVNAAHAVADMVKATGTRGKITVRTSVEDGHAVIAITDTGGGIPAHLRDKIFDPFFTTKEVGKGTGQGLPIVRSVIVDKHKGSVDFETEPGKGTTFFLRLPLNGPTGQDSDPSRSEVLPLGTEVLLSGNEAPDEAQEEAALTLPEAQVTR